MSNRTIVEIARLSGLNISELSSSIEYEGNYRPIMLICETINICNNNCIICAYSHMTRKKCIMSMEVYSRVIRSYCEMGGGCLSLTPVVGDVLLDKFLMERIKLAKEYKLKSISFTTNAIAAVKISTRKLDYIVNNADKILISVYGIDKDEYSMMSNSGNYLGMVSGIRKIISVAKDVSKIEIGFRLLRDRSDAALENWLHVAIGNSKIKFNKVTSYANWNILDTATKLPYDAKWIEKRICEVPCLIPIVALQVFSNGDVSFCPCDDFNRDEEFYLGNISKHTLQEMCNSDKYYALINNISGLPDYCKKCTFKVSISDLKQNKLPIQNPVKFIGG